MKLASASQIPSEVRLVGTIVYVSIKSATPLIPHNASAKS